MPAVYSGITGISLPSESVAFVIRTVDKMETMAAHRESSAKWRPGQIRLQIIGLRWINELLGVTITFRGQRRSVPQEDHLLASPQQLDVFQDRIEMHQDRGSRLEI
jgi:hypothetical protein